MAQRRCCGYDTDPDGELVIKSDEPAIVRWIFDRYLSGDSLGKIAVGLGKVVDMLYAKQIPLPIEREDGLGPQLIIFFTNYRDIAIVGLESYVSLQSENPPAAMLTITRWVREEEDTLCFPCHVPDVIHG